MSILPVLISQLIWTISPRPLPQPVWYPEVGRNPITFAHIQSSAKKLEQKVRRLRPTPLKRLVSLVVPDQSRHSDIHHHV